MLACVAGAKKGRKGEREKSAKVQKCKKISPARQAEIGPRVEKICSVKRLVVYHLCGGVAVLLGGKGRKVALPGGHFNRFPERNTNKWLFSVFKCWRLLA